jgi:GTP-binding protein
MEEQRLTQEQFKKGELLFKQSCTFMLGVADLPSLPDMNAPEIAFAGRSNVGKSSLINALFNDKTVARVSNTPGRTQQLNFFNLSQNSLYMVDMPGYGYAQAPKDLVAAWQALIKQYLLGRQTLERVYVLIDARHGIKKVDIEFMTLLDTSAVSYQIILTKSDKITPSAMAYLIKNTETILQKHGAAHPIVLSTSSAKKSGLENVRAEIAQFVAQ